MKKISVTLLTLLFTSGLLVGQELKTRAEMSPHSFYSFTWNTAFTLGDFSEWVASPSPAGFGFGGRYFLNKGFHAGFDIGWQRISQAYGYETYYGANGTAITATNYRFTWMVPFQLSLGYMFFPSRVFSPYVSLGIGGDYMEHHLVIQEYDLYETRWDFALNPEVGVLAKFGYYSNWAVLAAFNYKWTTNRITLIENRDSGHLQTLNLRIGICYLIF